MASKRRIRRDRERKQAQTIAEHEPRHDGKQAYPHEQAARVAAIILSQRYQGQTFSVYLCPIGEPHWHTGHAPWFVKSGRAIYKR